MPTPSDAETFDEWADELSEDEQRELAWEEHTQAPEADWTERRKEKREEKRRHQEYVDEITPDRAEWQHDSSRHRK